MTTGRILFVADSDSQLVTAHRLASHIAGELNWDVFGNIVPAKNRVSRRQIITARLDCPLTFFSMRNLVTETLLEYDAIVAFLPGARLHRLLTRLQWLVRQKNLPKRPVLITGYNGVVYEKHLEGLSWRLGYDLICINSDRDRERFTELQSQLGSDSSELVQTGVLLAQNSELLASLTQNKKTKRIKNVLFACQAIVPQALEEREYLIDKLRDYALTHPERGVYVKPRTLPGEATFHDEEFHFEELYRQRYGEKQPPNLYFAYGSFKTYLKRIDLLITVSSTAVFEAMAAGVPGAILTDVGIKESLGNHFFLGSGMMTTMDSLIADTVPRVNPDWLAYNGLGSQDSLSNATNAVKRLLDEQERAQCFLPFKDIFYDRQLTPYIYSELLPRDEDVKPMIWESISRKAKKLRDKPSQFFHDAWDKQARRLEDAGLIRRNGATKPKD